MVVDDEAAFIHRGQEFAIEFLVEKTTEDQHDDAGSEGKPAATERAAHGQFVDSNDASELVPASSRSRTALVPPRTDATGSVEGAASWHGEDPAERFAEGDSVLLTVAGEYLDRVGSSNLVGILAYVVRQMLREDNAALMRATFVAARVVALSPRPPCSRALCSSAAESSWPRSDCLTRASGTSQGRRSGACGMTRTSPASIV
jgi:hypothetical protein